MTNNKKLYPKNKVLLVDDDQVWVKVFIECLNDVGISNIASLRNVDKLMDYLDNNTVGTILLDLNFPEGNGEKYLSGIKEKYPNITVVVITGYSEVDSAIRCIKLGAYNYYSKTMNIMTLKSAVKHAVEIQHLKNENRILQENFLHEQIKNPAIFSDIITQNKKMRSIFTYIESVACSPEPVLIIGESGTGKELIAKSIHKVRNPKSKFIPVNIAGLDDNSFSDTLFGHAKGAFTGATKNRKGLIENSRGGVLVLDEIGKLSSDLQVKLLRVLQENEYYPLGTDNPIKMNTKILAVSNRSIKDLQNDNNFRHDFFYRISSHIIKIPPLRDRLEDIPSLLDHFLECAAKEMNKKKPTPPSELVSLLKSYDFPGNIRELRSMVYDAVSDHTQKVLSMAMFEKLIFSREEKQTSASFITNADANPQYLQFGKQLPSAETALNQLIKEALSRAKGNQSLASRMVNMNRATMIKRIKKYNLTITA